MSRPPVTISNSGFEPSSGEAQLGEPSLSQRQEIEPQDMGPAVLADHPEVRAHDAREQDDVILRRLGGLARRGGAHRSPEPRPMRRSRSDQSTCSSSSSASSSAAGSALISLATLASLGEGLSSGASMILPPLVVRPSPIMRHPGRDDVRLSCCIWFSGVLVPLSVTTFPENPRAGFRAGRWGTRWR